MGLHRVRNARRGAGCGRPMETPDALAREEYKHTLTGHLLTNVCLGIYRDVTSTCGASGVCFVRNNGIEPRVSLHVALELVHFDTGKRSVINQITVFPVHTLLRC